MTFAEVVLECFDNEDLVREYRRLYGSQLGQPRQRSGIEALVDRATSYVPPAVDENEARAFIRWVWDYVWTLLPLDAFEFRLVESP